MANGSWKATEREVAKRLGGRRVPVTGRARGDAPDVAHDRLSIEVKHRKELPAWLGDAMAQAVAAAKTGQTPIVVLHQGGQRFDRALVVVQLEDFTRLSGAAVPAQETTPAASADTKPASKSTRSSSRVGCVTKQVKAS